MSTLQVRNVPDDVHRALKSRAAASGRSLSEYVLAELTRVARQPTVDELLARISHQESVQPTRRAADLLGEERAHH